MPGTDTPRPPQASHTAAPPVWLADEVQFATPEVPTCSRPSSDDAGGIYHWALTSAIAGAFKRAAANLGDQFGLSLYGDGSLDPIVAHVVGTDGAPSDVQEGRVAVSEEMADLRLRAKRMLADAARAANLPLDAVAKRFQAVYDVEIGRAHPAQIISTAQQIIDATNT